MKAKLFRSVALCALLALLFASCGGPAATAMKLVRYEGAVRVSDADGKNVAPAEALGLYSGYGVATEQNGYAWIDLDSVKLIKMDNSTEIEIAKNGKDLEIEVLSGNLFFNITEPLAPDETLHIRASGMLVGIRGTCGWVEVPDADTLRVYLLEGSVACTAGESTATIAAGEMAVLSADGSIETQSFTAVPGFVWAQVRDDEALAQSVLEAAGIDRTPANPLSAFAEVLGSGNIVYTEWIDFDGDGSDELLTIYTEVRDGYYSDGLRIYQTGPDGPRCVGHGGSNTHSVETYSLVESGGRLFVRRYSEDGYGGYFDEYYGFVRQSDGTLRWGNTDMEQSGKWIMPHGEDGFTDWSNSYESDPGKAQALFAALQGKYTPVRELLTYDGASVTPAG